MQNSEVAGEGRRGRPAGDRYIVNNMLTVFFWLRGVFGVGLDLIMYLVHTYYSLLLIIVIYQCSSIDFTTYMKHGRG